MDRKDNPRHVLGLSFLPLPIAQNAVPKNKNANAPSLGRWRLFCRAQALAVCQAFRTSGLQAAGVLAQVSRNTFRRSSHAFVALLPVGRADFTVLFSELQGIHQTQEFVHAATQWQVVNDLR